MGRLRDICTSPQGDIYISTSNQDWNPKEGFPKKTDDRIIRISMVGKKTNAELLKYIADRKDEQQVTEIGDMETEGKKSYEMYCASCHKTDGRGVEDSFPSLMGSSIVNGKNDELIQLVLQGSARTANETKDKYGEMMPSFVFLSDEEIAKILTFIKAEFGGQNNPISVDKVVEVRSTFIKE